MEKTINFTRLRFVMLALSVVLITAFWGGTFLRGGFNFGIDFQAGLNQRIQITTSSEISEGDVKIALEGIESLQVQSIGNPEDKEFMVRVGVDETQADFQQTVKREILSKLEASFGSGSVEIRSSDYVGPRFAGSLTSQTIFLTVFALALILVYIWIRFKLNYAISAIAAIFHDVLFLLGFIGIFQIDFSTATIAAVLTIIGYSLNDTIVIFDRIRENSRIIQGKTFEEVINISVTQSLSRTIITSLTTLIAVTAIFILATGSIKLFALNLIVGVIVGTYSSVFIASSILLGWHNLSSKKTTKNVRSAKKENEKVVNFNKA
ncbi:protein translocase subunit SecF [Spirochaeta isovalerica]|uniref:Protein-export membrane protein SecF n=1 Tax=Spirochaeta isovalerica TaxID=150 RepID=A0A841RJM0_9SPIO|nr:protein translocase subunit SecF [Spirochaeta isovalerica]MBB6482492.1 preprotein translocase subunit SecF [Spirochaeta isovalerica]